MAQLEQQNPVPNLPQGLAEELRAQLEGAVITPQDAAYAAAYPVWNAMYDDRRPAAILRCAGPGDVASAVAALADTDLPVAVRGGGHHIAGFGTCDGGVVIDLGAMREVELGEGGAVARVAGGATLHEVDTATDPVARAVPLGVVSETGVAGLTLSGGVGWLTRLHGYTCDNLLAADVVTAGGELVRASASENPDLLWALRGGGGNFGVVTSFELRTHPVESVVVGEATWLVDGEAEVEALLRFYREWTATLPREATVWVVAERVGDGYDLPAEARGRLAVSMLACCAGPTDRGEELLAPMLRERDPEIGRTVPMRMVELQHLQDQSGAAAHGLHSYMKGEMVTELTDAMLADIAARSQELPTATSLFEMGMLGGALGDHDELGSAVGLRRAEYIAGYSMMATEPSQVAAGIEWTRAAWAPLREASTGGTYLNFSGDESSERVMGSLGASEPGKQERLRELKRRFDPQNFFRINHNIDPGA